MRIVASMAAASGAQQRTFAQTMRPACRLPMLTVGTLKVGVSTTPDDELPATSAAQSMAERYRRRPRLCTKPARPGCEAANACIISVQTCPPASAFDPVISQNTLSTLSMALHSACTCTAGDPASGAVSGW